MPYRSAGVLKFPQVTEPTAARAVRFTQAWPVGYFGWKRMPPSKRMTSAFM
jgi:hypothetical protein